MTLLERQNAAHPKVCGEFLSREAIQYLHWFGIDPLDFGAATIRCVRLAARSTLAEAPLPFTALSLSRSVLDEALIGRAAQTGCNVVRGVDVEQLARTGSGWVAESRNGSSWCAGHLFLATGKHDLKGLDRAPSRQRDLVGFKMHFRLSPSQTEAIRGAMELFLFPGGYGGLSLVEDNIANLCLVVRRSTLRRLGAWPDLLAAILGANRHIGRRLEEAIALFPRPLAVFPIPYGYLAARNDGLWPVGDQAAVIPSFTGDGMSIALHSGALAAEMFLAGRSAVQYQHTLRAQLRSGMLFSVLLSRAMVAAPGRALAPITLSIFPGIMSRIASSTRIPESALPALPIESGNLRSAT